MKEKIKEIIYPIYEKEIFSPIHGWPTKLKIISLYPRLKLRYYKNRLKYGKAAPNPFEILWIDPKQIDRFSAKEYRPPVNRIIQLGTVHDGEWDIKSFDILERKSLEYGDDRHFYFYYKEKFTESKFFQSMDERFENGLDWEDTDYYDFINSDYHRELHPNERTSKKQEIYEKIKKENFKPKKELEKSKISKDYFDDPIVDLSRNGKFLLRDGRHRVAIAIILGIDRIPVRVACRHKLWMKKLNDGLENSDELDRDLIDHPDFERLEK